MRSNLKRALCCALLLAAGAMTAGAQNRDPEAARIVTEDIDRFWEAFDKAAPEFPAEPFQTLYLDRGTPGLEDFLRLRIGSAEELAKTVRKYSRYYASARESTRRIRSMEPAIRGYLRAMKELYPDAVYPDVYFVVGRLTSGGTTSERALLIGAEMHGRTSQAPEDELGDWLRQVLVPVERVPHIVVHEFIHYQQKYPGSDVLLRQAIREGSADFLTELITGSHINQHVHEFAEPREAELWQEFKGKMHGTDLQGWLYTRQEGRPNDLGYWMGYKITKAFYDRAADKRQAVREILEIEDFDAFLAKSGYAERFDKAPAVRLVFEPATPADAVAAKEYEALWSAEGDRIVKELEARSGLAFEESEIRVIVVEGVSSSGFGAIPMRLRSSYPASTKKATLIHELGHRLQGRFFSKDDEDHPYLFLYLYDVWVALYGQEFADREVRVESARRGLYDYEAAWKEALAMTPEQRQARWQAFLESRTSR